VLEPAGGARARDRESESKRLAERESKAASEQASEQASKRAIDTELNYSLRALIAVAVASSGAVDCSFVFSHGASSGLLASTPRAAAFVAPLSVTWRHATRAARPCPMMQLTPKNRAGIDVLYPDDSLSLRNAAARTDAVRLPVHCPCFVCVNSGA